MGGGVTQEVWDHRPEYRQENEGLGMCNTGWGREHGYPKLVCALGGIGCNVDHIAIVRDNLRALRKARS